MSRRNRTIAALLLVPVIAFGAYAVRVALWEPVPLTGVAIDDGYSRVSGVVHVHTTLSDGSGTPEEVIAAARRAGLDFVAITDHNNVDARSYEGYQGETLVLGGSELATTAGHLVALGLDRDPAFRFPADASAGLLDIRDLGGVPFAAHPLSPRSDLQWSGWDLPGPWNLEIINGDSEWRRAGPRLLVALALYPVNSTYALLRLMTSPAGTLASWDALLAERDVVGIYGADAHSRLPIVGGWSLQFPSYDTIFSLARNHLLLEAPLSGEASVDRAAMLDALRSGRFYVGLDGLAPADGFSFLIESTDSRRWTMGQGVAYEPGLRVRAGGRVPAGVHIRLLRDGAVVAEAVETLDLALPGVGVYRVEATVDGWRVPWVISNPIAVFERETLAARVADWPSVQEPVEPVEILDDFDGKTDFVAARDTASEMNEDLRARRGDAHSGRAVRMAFRLGQPTPEHPDVFVALINTEQRDLEGREGITFWIRADGVYRMWVQVRDENPAASEESTESWAASVKTRVDWQQVSIPFARLRSISPRTDGQLDLDEVRAIVFVIDKGAMKPGSRGTIWLDELGVY